MDIEQYWKNVEPRVKASHLKKSIKNEIEEYEDKQLGIYEISKTKCKPIIEDVQEVKKLLIKTRQFN